MTSSPEYLRCKEIVFQVMSDAADAGLPAPPTKIVNVLCGYKKRNTGSVSQLLAALVADRRIKMLGRLGVQRVVHIVATGKTTAGTVCKKPTPKKPRPPPTKSYKFYSRERAPKDVTLYTLVHPKMLELVGAR